MVLHGRNAQGKTNALEAVYWLATLKPLRAHRPAELVRFDAPGASVAGAVRHEGLVRRFRVDLEGGNRRVQLDDKGVSDLGEYFGGIRAIAFCPQDAAIVTGEPKLRRQWLDRAAFTASPAHLDVARDFRRALQHKAVLLRASRPDLALLDVLDEQIARLGADLVERRVRTLEALRPEIGPLHARIAGGSGDLALRYATEAGGRTPEERRSTLRARLAAVRDDELRQQRTLAGPQRDRLGIDLDGQPARDFGSQGQVRSVVLALKLGELVAARRRGDAPLFLIDDVSSELDSERTARLVALLAELEVQVFATTTDARQLASLPPEHTLRVAVSGGALTPEKLPE